ncbi:uncharacterized protein ARMOST_02699 [Armillaria ostoyae]|uniref:Uncharacterized protein n=1 Tax=Armillaria ostoyae TaxID=47428 RepID=A0A284QSP0_ARMOS|nr:uncharacterized protein ARMOST_02699 [Armillaria ostoyae]
MARTFVTASEFHVKCRISDYATVIVARIQQAMEKEHGRINEFLTLRQQLDIRLIGSEQGGKPRAPFAYKSRNELSLVSIILSFLIVPSRCLLLSSSSSYFLSLLFPYPFRRLGYDDDETGPVVFLDSDDDDNFVLDGQHSSFGETFALSKKMQIKICLR